ncbi:MAG TPA: molybdopterin-dependent oxidoreductase, partial [Dehalococcoidia bacterium]|nr:molybdopterin-dependent oxidoreductase [Dehalococcoidia bacterium]
EDAQNREKFGERWKVSLPDTAGLTALEMIEQAAAGKIKGMLIVGENPVAGFPSPSLVKKALASLEFLVVVDMFSTETAKLATVVLPAASFAEKEGTFTNFEGRVQQINKAVKPVGASQPDWQIILWLAEAMNSPMPYNSPRQVMNEIEELVPFYRHTKPHTSLEKEELEWAEPDSGSMERRRLYKGLFPSGFWRFSPVQYNPRPVNPGDGYPLTLVTGSVLPHLGSGTRSQMASRLKRFSPHSWVETTKADASSNGFSDGDDVRVVSPAGAVTTTIRITHTLPAGTLFMPISFPESPVNALFDLVLDARTKAPSFKSCAVRLERINNDD